MKRQLILAFAMLMVFGVGGATFANTLSGCCCKGDSCPMMQKDASGKTADCCDDCDCCKDKATVQTASYAVYGVAAKSKAAKSKCKCCSGMKDAQKS